MATASRDKAIPSSNSPRYALSTPSALRARTSAWRAPTVRAMRSASWQVVSASSIRLHAIVSNPRPPSTCARRTDGSSGNKARALV